SYAERCWAIGGLDDVRVRRDGDRSATGPVVGAAGVPGASRPLPAATPDGSLTRLVGRRRELAAVATALGRSRLVTVVGLGGVGKSRLVTEVLAGRGGSVVRIDLGRGSGSFTERAAGAVGAVPVTGDHEARLALAHLLEGVDL